MAESAGVSVCSRIAPLPWRRATSHNDRPPADAEALPESMRALRFPIFLILMSLALCSVARAQTLVIESWRTEDQALWDNVLLPVFHRQHPGITVKFSPTARALYDQTLATRLETGSAGDLISCRPFDASLALYTQGHLQALDGLPALRHFPASSRIAWQTDDGRNTFCLPLASVMHGIYYNKAIFRRLGLDVPGDRAQWFSAMRTVQQTPGLTALALGTADRWESHQLLFTSIGPTEWDGERGRQALLRGEARLTDPPFLAAWTTLQRLSEMLPHGYQAMGYEDMIDLFGRGLAAMRPGGSWEIPQLRSYRYLELGVFPPPVRTPGDTCQVSDHLDIGIGINARSAHAEQARLFLEWLASAEFTQLYANAAVGFYPLADHPVTLGDPLAREMMTWRQRCRTTIRLNAQRLNRGAADIEETFWTVNAMVLNRQLSPLAAGIRLQKATAGAPARHAESEKPAPKT